ncbi:GGDEF domain-containing protein [Candidatus Daviesbacteria bacterium]|nr:GGDEF domain-containing protein [Candidatus Daviesbacteria bacterium]
MADSTPESEHSEQDPHTEYLLRYYSELAEKLARGEISKADFANQLTTERKALEKRADHDGLLTEFYNSSGFLKELDRAIDLAKRRPELAGSLLALDVDQFKRFNDTFGHPKGDELLKTYADVIQKQTRGTDILGRLGGDELAVYLVACDQADAEDVAKRIRATTLKTIKDVFPDLGWEQTISIGIAPLEEIDSPKSLRSRADEALYEAKQSKNIIIRHSSFRPPSPS